MQFPQYKFLGLSGDGITRCGATWKLVGGEQPFSCPAIIQDGEYIIIVGRMVSAGEVRKLGGSVEIGEQAIAVPRDVLLAAAQEMRLACHQV